MVNTYSVYLHNSGIAKIGLTPIWQSLVKRGDAVAVSQPTITEVGGGWYKFDHTIPLDEIHLGVIDAGAGVLLDIERYIPIDMHPRDFALDPHEEVFIQPNYNETADVLTMIIFLLRDGKLVDSGITNVDVTVYKDDHSVLFTKVGIAATGGVYISTKSAPALIKNNGYYAKATFTTDVGTIVSADAMIALE